ncbi:PAS domain S-box protein [Magnetospira sp. QH-2]|uniref:PAS domain-containing sensor histidine kinase n=1 Tax=Magnetospira sp. (strain QH-2) TaxID=1288970 RepID=UPI0003E80FC7|nr:PAS domain S-box protein [Magnetospira sp. QH-2]CCQ74081.1 Putative histidine kinase with two PAS domains and one PAS 4 domain [Magnetospira sp. QH-2]
MVNQEDIATKLARIQARIDHMEIDPATRDSIADTLDQVLRTLPLSDGDKESVPLLFEDLYNNAPDMFASVDARTKVILQCNDTLCRKLGYEKKELIGQPFTIIYHPDSLEKVSKTFANFTVTGEVHNAEFILRRRDGQVIPAILNVTAVRDDTGAIVASRSIWRDISGIVLARENLEKREQYFRSLFEKAPLGYQSLNDEGKFIVVNQAWLDMLGYTREDVIGRPFQDFLIDEGFVETNLPELKAKGEIQLPVTRMKCADGQEKIVHIDGRIGFDEDGNFLQTHCMLTDVTEQKKARDALLRSESFAQSIIENEPDCVKIIGTGGRLEYMNPAGLAMIEVDDLSQVKGKSVFPIITEEYREAFADLTQRILAGEEKLRLEFQIVGLKGTPRWLATHAVPIRDADGQVEALLGLTRDISAQKEAQAQVQKALTELKRSNEELEQFAYVSSHDLREPLRMVTSYLQFLQRNHGEKLDEEANEYIGFAIDGAQRMDYLIRDLLAYSRVNTHTKPVERVAAKAVADQAVINLKQVIEDKGATIEVGEMPTVIADKNQLLSLFQNLIGNALKYSSTERAPVIRVQAEQHDEEWHFQVSDNGIGIEPAYFQRIFVIFQRLHQREQYEGTGIGLAICKKIVANHGGEIWVNSDPGQGTTFTFTMPLPD